jgi:DNA-binding MarR family transcriptional regulator
MRPAHGFAMQAIGLHGATATEVGRRLGISKQAAGKTIERLEAVGYATRATGAADRRRKLVQLTPRGFDALGQSAAIFNDIRDRWVATLGRDQVEDLEAASLRQLVPGPFRLDVAGWLGGG